MKIYGQAIIKGGKRDGMRVAAEQELLRAVDRVQEMLAEKQLMPTGTWSTSPKVDVQWAYEGGDLVARNTITDPRYVYNDEGTGIYGEVGEPIYSHGDYSMPVPTGYSRKTRPNSLSSYAGRPPTGVMYLPAVLGAPKADWTGAVVRKFAQRIRDEILRATRKVRV